MNINDETNLMMLEAFHLIVALQSGKIDLWPQFIDIENINAVSILQTIQNISLCKLMVNREFVDFF